MKKLNACFFPCLIFSILLTSCLRKTPLLEAGSDFKIVSRSIESTEYEVPEDKRMILRRSDEKNTRFELLAHDLNKLCVLDAGTRFVVKSERSTDIPGETSIILGERIKDCNVASGIALLEIDFEAMKKKTEDAINKETDEAIKKKKAAEAKARFFDIPKTNFTWDGDTWPSAWSSIFLKNIEKVGSELYMNTWSSKINSELNAICGEYKAGQKDYDPNYRKAMWLSFFASLAWKESSYNPKRISNEGDYNILQLSADTQKNYKQYGSECQFSKIKSGDVETAMRCGQRIMIVQLRNKKQLWSQESYWGPIRRDKSKLTTITRSYMKKLNAKCSN